MYARFTFKTFRLVVIILLMSYFVGMYWLVYCRFVVEDSGDENDGFIRYFKIEEPPLKELGVDLDQSGEVTMQNIRTSIIAIYWAFTTLATVGFGDFHPVNDAERALCSLVLMIGVTMFTYIMANFIEILSSFKQLNSSFDDGENLTKWFGLLKKFNNGRMFSIQMKVKIEKYFDYRWTSDRNIAVSDEEDQKLIMQLPDEVQLSIFNRFLYRIFLSKFRKFFEMKMMKFKPRTL